MQSQVKLLQLISLHCLHFTLFVDPSISFGCIVELMLKTASSNYSIITAIVSGVSIFIIFTFFVLLEFSFFLFIKQQQDNIIFLIT